MMAPSLVLALALAVPPAQLSARFAAAVEHFDAGRYAEAADAFAALEAQAPSPVVRFNLALCSARLDKPLEAVALFEALLAQPQGLSAERLARARTLLEEQRLRLGTLALRLPAEVTAAAVTLDGLTRPLPPDGQLKVDPGAHNLAVQVPGYFEWRQAFRVAPGGRAELAAALLPQLASPASVRFNLSPDGVELRLDGAWVGVSPLPALSLPAGRHRFSFTRRGYLAVEREVDLAEGATQQLEAALAEDLASVDRGGVALQSSEQGVVVSVDGAPLGERAQLELPVGPHRLRLEKEGFFPVERAIDVPQGSTLELPIRLEPTAATRASLERLRFRLRLAGGLSLGLGSALTLAGAIMVGANQRSVDTLTAQLLSAREDCKMGGGRCGEAAELAPQVTERETIRFAGWLMVGTGALLAAAGGLLLGLAPNLDRAAGPLDSPLLPLAVRLELSVWGVRVSGAF